MRFTAPLHAILRSALASLALVGSIGSASAGVVVTGDWDPAIGHPFNMLGWRGQAKFDVPASCLVAGPVSVTASDPCLGDGGALNFLGATVEFYELDKVQLPGGAPTLDTVLFGAGALVVSSIDVLDGKVKNVTTDYTAFQSTVSGSTFNELNLYGFAIRFDGNSNARLVYGLSNNGDGFSGTPAGNEELGQFARASVQYTTPEPSTLALVVGAAALAARARRRA